MPSVIIATAGYDHDIRFWDASSTAVWRKVEYKDSLGSRSSLLDGGNLKIEKEGIKDMLTSFTLVYTRNIVSFLQQVNCLEITPDKTMIAAAGHSSVKIFEIQGTNPNPVSSYEGHTNNVSAVGFHKDGNWMFTGSEDKTIKIWDIRAPGCQRDYESRGAVTTVVLHPNQGELISGDQDGTLRVWDLTANKCRKEMVPEGEIAIRSVSIAQDASMLCVANNKGNVYVYNPRSIDNYVPIAKVRAHPDSYILKCVLSPDMKFLATASSDKYVKIWNTADWTLNKKLIGHQKWVWDCVFSADSSYLVTASSDHFSYLWEISSGTAIRTYRGHKHAVVAVALNDSNLGE